MKKYNKYKDSGIEWIGEIPEHWDTKRFNFLFSFSRGLSITKQNLKNEGVPCVNYGEIHSKFGFEVSPDKHLLKCVDEEYLSNSIKSLLSRGDFVFADTSEDIEGSGNFTCLDSDTPTFAGYHTIIATQKKEHNYRFLAYVFDSLEFRNQIRCEVKGIKVFSITQEILKNTDLILPTPKEQTAIANYLDHKTIQIDELIADKKRLLELYEEGKTAIINQAVTKGINSDVPMKDSGIEWLGEIPEHWEVLPIKYALYTPITDGPHETPELLPDGIPFISAEAIKNDKIDFSKKRGFISREEHERFSLKYKPQVGDVYMIKSGATTGNLAIVETDIEFNIWSPLAAMRPNFDVLLSEFLFYFMKSKSFFSAIEIGWNYGTQQNIGMKVLENIRMVLPSKNEQKEIVQYIETEITRINSKVEKTKKLIDLLTEYRAALISEVVTGKIKVI